MIEMDTVLVAVPQSPTEAWSKVLNSAFSGGKFLLELTTETWWTDPQRSRASAYLQSNDEGGPNGWRKDLQGIFDAVIYTNLPEAAHRSGNGFMIGLREAKIAGHDKEIDEGYITLVGLHDVIGPLRFRLTAQ